MSKTRTLAILVFDDVEVLDFCGPFEVFSVANRFTDPPAFNVLTVAEKAGPVTPKLEATVVLDTRKAQEMIAANAAANPASGPLGLSKPAAAPSAKERVGILAILEGRTDQSQYVLTGKMTMIGKSAMATIRLKGFFAPKTAALISRRDNKYFLASSHKKIRLKINGEEVSGQYELKEGDIIEVARIKAAFSFQE